MIDHEKTKIIFYGEPFSKSEAEDLLKEFEQASLIEKIEVNLEKEFERNLLDLMKEKVKEYL